MTNFSNKAKANLLASISSAATNIILELGKWALFPTAPFQVCIEQYNATGVVIAREIATCTSITGDVLTVTRATEAIPNDDTTSVQSQIARNFDLSNWIVQVSNVITGDFVNTLENSIENAVHKTGDETITGTKTFSWGIKAQKITLRDNSIEEYSTDSDSAEIAFNYYWYNTGTTRFRNTTFFNGKWNEIFRVIGSTGKIKYSWDGTYWAGKVLTSDASGNATWQTGLTAWKTSWDFTTWEDIFWTATAPKALYLWGDGKVYNTASNFIGKFIGITTQTVSNGGTINVIMNGIADVSWFNTGSRYFVNTPAYAWSTKASMPTARISSAAAEYLWKIYVVWWVTWLTPLNANQEYDTSTNTWATKANLPNARYWLSASTVSWKIYFYGGNPTNSTWTNIMEEYNPSANTWLSKTAGLVSSSYHSEFVINDKIYIAGGVLVGYAATNLVSEYTPATDTWAVKAVVPISRWGSCSASINWVGLVYWWTNGTSNNDSLYEYNATSNIWVLKASSGINFPAHPSSFVIGGKLYVCGWYSSGVLATVMSYDPNTNTWTNVWVMNTWVYQAASSYYNGKWYIFGGQSNGGTIATTQEYANSLVWGNLTNIAITGILAGQAVSPTKFLLSNNIL
jgi:Kelch motif/Lower baseplate protein N-terminal domain